MSNGNNGPSKQAKCEGKVIHRNAKGEIINWPPTRIPDTPAWQRCKDVIYSFAWKMVDAANEAMGNFIQSNYPGAKTIGKEYADRKFKRTIEWGGEHITLIYDYETKTVGTYAPDY